MHEGERREDRVVARTAVGKIGTVHNTAGLDQAVGAAGTNAAEEDVLFRPQVDGRGMRVADREEILGPATLLYRNLIYDKSGWAKAARLSGDRSKNPPPLSKRRVAHLLVRV